MNNKEMSSVNFMYDAVQKKFPNLFAEIKKELDVIHRTAQAMHKEEMIEFAQEVFRNRYNQVYQSLGSIADDKYNETFEK